MIEFDFEGYAKSKIDKALSYSDGIRQGYIQAKSEWISLTDEDMEFLFPHKKSAWLTETLKIFEAKLKQKNNIGENN